MVAIGPIYAKEYTVSMKKPWIDPAKRPPNPETLNITGDFGKFTETMKRLMRVKSSDVSRAPGVSTSARLRSSQTH